MAAQDGWRGWGEEAQSGSRQCWSGTKANLRRSLEPVFPFDQKLRFLPRAVPVIAPDSMQAGIRKQAHRSNEGHLTPRASVLKPGSPTETGSPTAGPA